MQLIEGRHQPFLETDFSCSGLVLIRVRKRLIKWGRLNYRHFPWREEKNAWLSFLAEFLLQRTQAQQVAAIYEDLRSRFYSPQALASAGEHGARHLTDRLGLHRKGRLLLSVATTLAEQGKSLPDDARLLQKMKGVGPYTAAAWLSLHRRKRAVIIDTNIARWMARLTGRALRKDVRRDKALHLLCDSLTPSRAFKDYNYAILDFTMTICTNRNPLCCACPLATDCIFSKTKKAERKRRDF